MQGLAVIQRHIHQQHSHLSKYVLRTGALLIGGMTLLANHTAQARMLMHQESDTAVIRPLLAQTSSSVSGNLSNGVYLFGEKPLPDQLQTAYMIFEARADEVVGAFYSPHSSFDCFRGHVDNTQLSLAITETYSQEEYAYALNLEDTTVAGPGERQFAIEGFYQIDPVSENDLRMLSTCQDHYSQTI